MLTQTNYFEVFRHLNHVEIKYELNVEYNVGSIFFYTHQIYESFNSLF